MFKFIGSLKKKLRFINGKCEITKYRNTKRVSEQCQDQEEQDNVGTDKVKQFRK